jgi:hypothetical protein
MQLAFANMNLWNSEDHRKNKNRVKPICICHKKILNEFLRWKMAIKSKGIPRAYDKILFKI